MDEPDLEWTLSMRAPPLLRLLNAVNAELPLWTWRSAPLLRLREWVARHYLGYGDIDLSFTTASGHETVLLARENYLVHAASASLDGDDLGTPVRLDANPTVGDVPLPRVPSFVVGGAQARIIDPAEYQRATELASAR